MFTRLIMNILLVLALGAMSHAVAQEGASKSYERAYGFILDEKWTEAQKALGEFIEKYPKSSSVPAAQYWHCYTRDKLGQNKETVFRCYEEFVKDYPKSKWADDARTNLVNIGY